MEYVHPHVPVLPDSQVPSVSTDRDFIVANTLPATLDEIRHKHIIPVFSRDNEPLISHGDFIESVQTVVQYQFPRETILDPAVRLSHPIKGRIPEAKHKPARDLLESEQTIYYERMAFVIEIPSIMENVAGNPLALTVGGVKAYNLDNLSNRKGNDEHFKVFIGFQNQVCTNLCVWSDGYQADLRVKSLNQLVDGVMDLVNRFSAQQYLRSLQRLENYSMTEGQFAQLIGRCRLYQYLPAEQKRGIEPLLLSDTQLNTVVRDYYRDVAFCRDDRGDINLWRVYNLFTGANKSSYIDTFLDRSLNAYELVTSLSTALDGGSSSWYLH
jgi:hypothetical protein